MSRVTPPQVADGHPSPTPSRADIGGHSSRRRSRRDYRMGLAIAVVALVAIVISCWLGWRAVQVKENIEAATHLAAGLDSDIAEHDSESITGTTEQIQLHTEAAKDAAADPIWRASGALPWVGQNFSAVTTMAVAADAVADAAAPLIDTYSSDGLSAFSPRNGKIALEPIQKLSSQLRPAAATVNAAHDSLAQIDDGSLLPVVSQPLAKATEALDGFRRNLDSASAAAEILPGILGADGKRSYLVLVQNNAEVRATGGIPGALVVLTTDGGRIELSDHGSASDLGRFKPPLEVDEEQERIYTTRLGGYMQNVNLTPDFPTAAATAKAMWELRNSETKIDGVIALDAVVLAQILEATGPVKLSSLDALPVDIGDLPSTLTSVNVVKTLLSDVYREIEEPQGQDAYFAAVANDIFSVMKSGSSDPLKILKALQQSSEAQRLFVWSEAEKEQVIIAGSPLGGSISTAEPTIGVYFNDGTGAKMDYYVERQVRLIERCQPDGYYRYAVQATLTNTAPKDAAASLPEYVTGGGKFGVAPGTVRTNLYAYGPPEWLLESASVDGEPSSFGSYRHGDSPVAGLTVSLKPGESTTVEFEFATLFETNEPLLRATPTIQPRSEMVLPAETGPDCAS